VGGVGMASILQELESYYNTSAEWLLYYQDRLRQYYKDLNYIHDCRFSMYYGIVKYV
jgi:hypothetical protein